MALTKASIIEKISDTLGFPKKQAAEVLETLAEILKETLASGEDVMISGFGKFVIREKGERKGRNPATNQDMMLEARRVVTFRCSGVLKDKVNPPEAEEKAPRRRSNGSAANGRKAL